MYIYRIDRIGRRYRVHHRLTPRDLQILKFIHNTRTVDTAQIRAQFWPGQSDNHHHLRRLRALKRMGILETNSCYCGQPWRVELTSAGREKAATP